LPDDLHHDSDVLCGDLDLYSADLDTKEGYGSQGAAPDRTGRDLALKIPRNTVEYDTCD